MTNWMGKGRTAVITGAGGGIGLATARRLAETGMNIVIADVKQDDLAEAETSLASTGAEILSLVCDVSDFGQVQQLQDAVTERFGKVHCLMNNAGIGRMGTKPWEDLDAFNQMINVNLMGVVHGCHAFIPAMLFLLRDTQP